MSFIPSFYECDILSEMNIKQRLILVLFAIVDIVIVVFLASTVVKTWSSYPEAMVQSKQLTCAQHYLDALNTHQQQVTFSMDKDVIHITLATSNMEKLDDTEFLWTLIDQLGQIAFSTDELCLEPNTLIVQQTISNEIESNFHMSIISINDLISWTTGQLSDNQLAAQIKYRQTSMTSD